MSLWKQPLKAENLWISVLSEFSEDRMLRALSCRTVWSKEVCEKGHVVVRPRLCRDRLVCPVCAEKYSNDRVKKTLSDFEHLVTRGKAKLYLIHIVFTFPSELWGKILENPDLAYRSVYEALEGLHEENPGWYLLGRVGGVARLHLWSSREPFKIHPHVHVVVPNRILKSNGWMRWLARIRPWFTQDSLRFRWKLALKKVFGFEFDDGKLDVFVRYIDVKRDRGKAVHVLRYVFRQYVYDLFRKGLDDKIKPEDHANILKVLELESKYHFVRWFGYLASNGRKWLKLRKLDWMEEAYDTYEMVEEARCVVCGAKIIKEDRLLWSEVFKSGDG